MKKCVLVLVVLVALSAPGFAATRKHVYSLPCNALWPAVKDVVRNSGEYAVMLLDNNEMMATYAIGVGPGLRMGSAVLNAKGDNCELQIRAFSPFPSDDAGSFEKRVDASLAQLKSAQSQPAKDASGQK